MNYSYVCEAKTKKEMKERFALLLDEVSKKFGGTHESNMEMQLSNIGYFAGYYDEKTRKNVYEWLNAVHPIFGNNSHSAEEAFNIGKKEAK